MQERQWLEHFKEGGRGGGGTEHQTPGKQSINDIGLFRGALLAATFFSG